MAMNDYQFVDFEQYCHMCERFKERDDYGTVCHECLLQPARDGSHIPANFKLDENYKPNFYERTLAMFNNK